MKTLAKFKLRTKYEETLLHPARLQELHPPGPIAAALARGESILANALRAEDTELTARALASLGAHLDWQGHTVRIRGTGGRLQPGD